MCTTSHHHFGVFRSQVTVAVIDDERNFGDAHRSAFFCSREDDALHFVHTQNRGALFAEHPTNRVHNVRLSRSVRTDNCGKTVSRESDFCPLSKRLKAENFEFGNFHGAAKITLKHVFIQNPNPTRRLFSKILAVRCRRRNAIFRHRLG